MSMLPIPLLAFLLQSNQAIAQAVGKGTGLPIDASSYTGMTGLFAQVFLTLVHTWAGLLGNYGIAIILTAFTVRLLLSPLTRQQIRGMKLMQMLQPVNKEIVRFYPNKADQNAKMMELYSTYKINPLAGCLPLAIQFPILIGVYRALYDASFAGHSFLGIQLLFPVSLTSARGFGHGPDMADIIDVTVAQLGLHHQIWYIPTNVPLIGGGFWYWPALALVVLYAGSSFLLQRTMKKVNAPHPEFEAEFAAPAPAPGDAPAQPDFGQQMQRQMGFMNVMILVIAFIFSAGALVYFVVQNLLMCLEYTLLSRGGGPKFDARELKAFIRKPPEPREQMAQGAGKAPSQVDKAMAERRHLPGPGIETNNGNPGEMASESADGSVSRLPRKKRRRK